MARRRPRTRAQELEAHVTIAKAGAELCAVLMQVEPQASEFMVARKMLLDGVTALEQQQKAAEAPAGEPKA